MDYSRIDTATDRTIQKYLDEGWHIIKTTETVYPGEGSHILYHVGYPLKNRVEDLLKIIRDYEQHGFKEQLFEKIASLHGEKAEDYINDGGVPMDEPAKYFSWYETAVRNKLTTFSKNRGSSTEYFF